MNGHDDKPGMEDFPWHLVAGCAVLWIVALLVLIDWLGCSSSTPC